MITKAKSGPNLRVRKNNRPKKKMSKSRKRRLRREGH
jgi:hypothetical protein